MGAGGGCGDGKRRLAMLVAYNFRSDGDEMPFVGLRLSPSPLRAGIADFERTRDLHRTADADPQSVGKTVEYRGGTKEFVVSRFGCHGYRTEALDATKAKTKQQFLLHLSTFDESKCRTYFARNKIQWSQSAFEPEALEAARNAAVGAIRDLFSMNNVA
eukprot:CAMPEP_0194449738 /NCGR_PEP_ID=MMETSP0176-20130528/130319_1 /TAXON_ID=216777 /ORGANISM="Proboscia alata, Strain PI-D3" /LENGTH=158 /DNA_ID=CAMNT_0039276913 /DNA_START=453 /DNA_END=930 /DNA_ORIENTATION=+